MEAFIRQLQEDDALALRELRTEALRDHPGSFGEALEEHLRTPPEVSAKRLREASLDNFVLGAFSDGVLRGMAGFHRDWGMKRRHRGHVWGMYVSPALRGCGTGRVLLGTLLERARGINGLDVVLLGVAAENVAAFGLYRSVGFEEYGREPRALLVDGAPVTEVLMRYEIRR